MAAAGASCRQVSQLLLESRPVGNVGETVADAWLPPHSGSGEDWGAAATEGTAWQARQELASVVRPSFLAK